MLPRFASLKSVYASAYLFALGNPVAIRETEYDTELPVAQTQPEDIEPWQPHPSVQDPRTSQTLSYTLSVFRASSTLGLYILPLG